MKRLTYRDKNGIADLKMTNLKDSCEYCINAIEKLAYYEDLEELGYKMANIDKVVEQLEGHAIEFEAFGICSDFVELTHAIGIVKGGAE